MANKTIIDLETDLVKPYIDKTKTAYLNNINSLGCKNLLPNRLLSEVVAGVTMTVNDDGTISLSGTSTGIWLIGLLSGIRESTTNQNKFSLKELGIDKTKKYVLSANSNTVNCEIRLYFYDSSKTQIGSYVSSGSTGVTKFDFLTDYVNAEYAEANLYIKSGQNTNNTLLKPMICLESDYDLDPSYVPYGMPCTSIPNLGFTRWDELAISGAVNLLPNNGKTKVLKGITWTVNDDGTVTATGAVTAGEGVSEFEVYRPSDGSDPFVGQPVRLSGCPAGGSSSLYYIQFYRVTSVDGSIGTEYDKGYGQNIVWRNDHSGIGAIVSIKIFEAAGTVNLTFKPMISPIGYKGDYVPYVAPNKTLTKKVETLEENLSQVKCLNSGSFKQSSKTITFNNSCRFMLVLTQNTVGNAYDTLLFGVGNAGMITNIHEIYKGSAITIDTSTDGQMTITNSGTGTAAFNLLILNGGTATIS